MVNDDERKLLSELFMLSSQDEGEYTKLSGYCGTAKALINSLTEKAVLIASDDFTNGTDWIPKSQLRIDTEGNYYLANWLFEKKSQ